MGLWDVMAPAQDNGGSKGDGEGEGSGFAAAADKSGEKKGGFTRQLTEAEVEAIMERKRKDREEADRVLELKRIKAQEEEERRAEEVRLL